MASGRTSINTWRVYMDGYDMSGYSRTFGPLACTFDEGVDDAITLAVKATMPGQATLSCGTLNGLFDNTETSGLHVIASGAGVSRNLMFARGVWAAPVNNDWAFCGTFMQTGYETQGDSNPCYVSIPFAQTSAAAQNMAYAAPWGRLLHAKLAATAANSATGLDEAAQTTLGGFMAYQVFAGNGTAAIKVQDASTNSDGSFGDLLSTGTISMSSPIAGTVALAKTATVKRYVRWQIALGTASTVTFALSWHRNYNY